MLIDPDEWAAWRNHPITRYLFDGVERRAQQIRDETMAIFFDADGMIDPSNTWLIHYNRGVFDAYSAVYEINLTELNAIYTPEETDA